MAPVHLRESRFSLGTPSIRHFKNWYDVQQHEARKQKGHEVVRGTVNAQVRH